jgi:hypothetical protein
MELNEYYLEMEKLITTAIQFDWELIVYRYDAEDGLSMENVFFKVDGKYEDMLALEDRGGMSERQSDDYFKPITKCAEQIRNLCMELYQKKWSHMAMVIQPNHTYEVEVSYEKFPEDINIYDSVWKYKYLGIPVFPFHAKYIKGVEQTIITEKNRKMGLFDIFTKEENNNQNEVDAGWNAITQEFERIYKGQKNPRHYGTLIKWSVGGNDPLDGISIYEAADYWHFVTYGLTELYNKTTLDDEVSGFGYELTFKLKKDDYTDIEKEFKNICGILQSIARITYTQNEIFGPYEYIRTGQTVGIDAEQKSNINGFICIPDETVSTLQTSYGKVEFLELVGMTDAELRTLSGRTSVMEMYERLGSDVTSYNRHSLV